MTETSGWPDGATLALSLVVNVEEGSEMSLADGDPGPDAVDELGVALRKPVRNFGNESNYRYGLKAGAPRILALLRRYGVPATFTAAALSLERAPDLARRIVADGHEVCSHGWRWVHQYRMEEDEERAHGQTGCSLLDWENVMGPALRSGSPVMMGESGTVRGSSSCGSR